MAEQISFFVCNGRSVLLQDSPFSLLVTFWKQEKKGKIRSFSEQKVTKLSFR